MCLHAMHRDNRCVTKQGIFIVKKVLNLELKVDEYLSLLLITHSYKNLLLENNHQRSFIDINVI